MVRRKQRTQRGGVVDENTGIIQYTPEQIIKRCRETIAELKSKLDSERKRRVQAEQELNQIEYVNSGYATPT